MYQLVVQIFFVVLVNFLFILVWVVHYKTRGPWAAFFKPWL